MGSQFHGPGENDPNARKKMEIFRQRIKYGAQAQIELKSIVL